jgi:transcriptional regulator with XRE-family HTH domain
MDIREVFARNLRKARNGRRLSQEALAHEADVDRTYVSALERGVYNATIVMVAKLAKALDVEPKRIASRRGKAKNAQTQIPLMNL